MSYIGSFIVTVIADVLHIVLSVVSFEAFFVCVMLHTFVGDFY